MAIWKFEPLMQERIWGGRNLEGFGRFLPAGKKIGESWELVDRAEAQSVVEGEGKTLGSLWSGPDRKKLFGTRACDSARFPILIKLLDAQEKLSLQVTRRREKPGNRVGNPKRRCGSFWRPNPVRRFTPA